MQVVPRHCLGITLDCADCLRILQDAELVPQVTSTQQLQVLFQRAAFLQTRLFMDFTLANTNSELSAVYRMRSQVPLAEPDLRAFNYSSIRRLCYIGFVFLVYCLAEALEGELAQPARGVSGRGTSRGSRGAQKLLPSTFRTQTSAF